MVLHFLGWAYNSSMTFKLYARDLAEMLPMPEVPEQYGARNDEEQRVLQLVQDGLQSGAVIPVDDAFFARLQSRISQTI